MKQRQTQEYGGIGELSQDRCYRFIESLTDETKQQVRTYADRCLKRFGLWDTTGNDLLQDAFLAILSGTQTGRGRNPRPDELRNAAAFTAYLKDVINSLVTVLTTKRKHQFVHEPIDGAGSQIEAAYSIAQKGLDENIGLTNLRAELFRRLNLRCPIHLRSTLTRWEESRNWADDVPFRLIDKRKRRHFRMFVKNECNDLGEF